MTLLLAWPTSRAISSTATSLSDIRETKVCRSSRGVQPSPIPAAARRALRVRSGLAAVAEWEADNGPLTAEELDAARHRAGLATQRRTA